MNHLLLYLHHATITDLLTFNINYIYTFIVNSKGDSMKTHREEKIASIILRSNDGEFFILPRAIAEPFAISSDKTIEIQSLFDGDVIGQGASEWTLDNLISLWEDSGRPQPAFVGDKLVGLKISFPL